MHQWSKFTSSWWVGGTNSGTVQGHFLRLGGGVEWRGCDQKTMTYPHTMGSLRKQRTQFYVHQMELHFSTAMLGGYKFCVYRFGCKTKTTQNTSFWQFRIIRATEFVATKHFLYFYGLLLIIAFYLNQHVLFLKKN